MKKTLSLLLLILGALTIITISVFWLRYQMYRILMNQTSYKAALFSCIIAAILVLENGIITGANIYYAQQFLRKEVALSKKRYYLYLAIFVFSAVIFASFVNPLLFVLSHFLG